MIIMSSTSISRSQPAFALEDRTIRTDYFKCSMINVFKLNKIGIKAGQIHLCKVVKMYLLATI